MALQEKDHVRPEPSSRVTAISQTLEQESIRALVYYSSSLHLRLPFRFLSIQQTSASLCNRAISSSGGCVYTLFSGVAFRAQHQPQPQFQSYLSYIQQQVLSFVWSIFTQQLGLFCQELHCTWEFSNGVVVAKISRHVGNSNLG